VAALGLVPCNLTTEQRNILPDLSAPWKCLWPHCDGPGAGQWTVPQHFYWHVSQHASSQKGQLPLICQWPGCNKTATAVSKLKEHMRCHSNEKMVACPGCGGFFASRAKFLDHMKRQEKPGEDNVDQQLCCTICDKTFMLPRLLKDHMRSHVNQYPCHSCSKTCPTPSTLANHIRYRHTTERPHQCQFCQYKGKTMADIRSHLRVHFNEVSLHCSETGCSFSCRTAATLDRHRNKVHMATPANAQEPLYWCHLCSLRVSSGGLLSRHLTSSHSINLPSGHSRFRYKADPTTGLYSLDTTRLDCHTHLLSHSSDLSSSV